MLLLVRDNLCENHAIDKSDFERYEQYDIGLMTMNMTLRDEYKKAAFALADDIVDQVENLEKSKNTVGVNQPSPKNEVAN